MKKMNTLVYISFLQANKIVGSGVRSPPHVWTHAKKLIGMVNRPTMYTR
jgi:hypothetical protein